MKEFKPTRDFNADDVLFSFNRQWKPDNPYSKVSGGKYDYFNDMDMPALLDAIEKKDDYTVVFHLKTPNVAILANLAMDFASISSAEYADFLLKKGNAGTARSGARRHRAVLLRRLSEGRGDPLQEEPGLFRREGAG